MPDPISRLNAALEGRYAIDRMLGEGGMATVFLANDLKHERKVAIKVLKPELAAVVGGERFLAEIKTTANLQHPHILPLFDSGEVDGFLFYVMPYIEGETLRERIDREKQLSVSDAVSFAGKVADALDYAHERGVVHRDIKPGNILLSERGEPLVADFGIALAVSAAGGGRITETGLSLGTPHYMSPEQATGDREVDPRSDVYALGCVLYEMLAGRPPFAAATAQGVLVQILTSDPQPITMVRRSTPPHVEATLARALEKLPADRFETAAEFVAALADEGFRYTPTSTPTVAQGQPAGRPLGPWADVPSRLWIRDPRSVVALAATLALAGSLFVALDRPAPPDPAPVRLALSDFPVRVQGNTERLAISPDGSWIAIASRDEDGQRVLHLRRSDQREVRTIPGTEGAWGPTFSPDSRWVAFVMNGQIRRMEVSGGPILPVAEGIFPHWGLPDTLVYVSEGGLFRVSPSGGEPRRIADDEGIPHLLPGGQAVVYSPFGQDDPPLRVADLDSGDVTDLTVFGKSPIYVPTGHLLYGTAQGSVMAVPFDAKGVRVTGDPSPVITAVHSADGDLPHFDVSANGTAVYGLPVAGFSQGTARLVRVDLSGNESEFPLSEADFFRPSFSPDGEQIVYETDAGIRIYDLVTGENRMLVPGAGTDFPSWSPDGRYIYFGFSGPNTLMNDPYRILADGSGEMEEVFSLERRNFPITVAPDGARLIAQDETGSARGVDLLLVTESQGGWAVSDFLRADWNETMPMISPDGTRIAYASDEEGQWEVYVRSFPDARNPVKVSQGGGSEPLWAPDGSAVYYRAGPRIMRADVRPGPTFAVARPQFLFEGNWVLNPGPSNSKGWQIHPDGQSFVMVRPTDETSSADEFGLFGLDVEIVVNWYAEMKARLGESD